jgi:shikimate dehydrogenase
MGEKNKKAGLIGYPLKHSISPAMHNAAFAKLGLPYEYILLETPAEELKQQLAKLRKPEFIGANVTIPHKEAVTPYLDDLSELAKSIGAVNTIKNDNGKLIGHNTDATGFIVSLKEDAGFDPKGKKIFIMGGGGAARAAAISLLSVGAGKIIIGEAIKEKGEKLAGHLNAIVPNSSTTALTSNEIIDALKECALVINASPVGMHPKENDSPLKGFAIPSQILVYDLVYNPYETKLIKDAKKAGAKTTSGLGMLIRQAILAFEIFTDLPAPDQVMREAAYEALQIR